MTDAQRARFERLKARAQTIKTERNDARGLLARAQARAEALKNATYWAELDSGASIAVGDEARYLTRTYRCVQAHTKALLRAPTNGVYWTRLEDDE